MIRCWLLIGVFLATACLAVDLEKVYSPFRSRTDLLPSKLNVTKIDKDNVTDQPLFLAPWSPGEIKASQTYLGPHIFSGHGNLIWTGFGLYANSISNFMPFKHDNETKISFYDGNVADSGVGFGSFNLMNNKYQVVQRLGNTQGYLHDFHEFQVTGEDTAAFSTYKAVPYDLSDFDDFDGDEGWVYENLVTEVNMTNDEVVFQWHSLDHISVGDTKVKQLMKSTGASSSVPFDYLHLNSIQKDDDGNYLLSCRHTWSLYYIEGKSGKVLWRLGKSEGDNDWDIEDEAVFAYQHDARWVDPSYINKKEEKNVKYISLFDNSQTGGEPENYRDYSRGMIIKLDSSDGATDDKDKKGKVTLVHEYKLPDGSGASASQGSTQVLSNSNVVVGWGSNPYVTEHKLDGTIVFEAVINDKEYASYRAFKAPFEGDPQEHPAVASVYSKDDNKTTCYMSWNGATKVSKWEVHSGRNATGSKDSLLKKADKNKEDFETVVKVDGKHDYITVKALASNDSSLASGVTKTFEVNQIPEQKMQDDDDDDSSASTMKRSPLVLLSLLTITYFFL
ncbi:hypothetical protein TRICI_005794 [Trichomonascus ciferrii]|uniref:ASST-domain-containing protein n=1 Tax=Trichomonascus ciferrii TaxID=44093 RepID=A0A642UPA3_9ASCO|nr:hypothetical protein TRICI_005794 [Trichomonascus ciferrii]